ncbi:MAG: sulfotransferase [Chloroflexota bacterium]
MADLMPLVQRKPDFFIVGAPKCGTTSLHRYLVGHPEIFMPIRPKEPMFFENDRLANFGMSYPDDMAHYLDLFARAGDAQRVGEASTSYLESPLAASRIHDFNPDARIIAMLRDPVAMIASLHSMRVSQGLEHSASLSAALDDEQRRRGFGVVGDQSSIRYRDRARFSSMLPPWFDAFGRDRVHIVLLEDMAADGAGQFERVLLFLGVDPAYRPANLMPYNEREWPRSLLIARLSARFRRPWVRNSPSDRLARHVYHLLGRINRRDVPRQPIPAAVVRQLRADLGPDVDQLSVLLGRDLRSLWWSDPAT